VTAIDDPDAVDILSLRIAAGTDGNFRLAAAAAFVWPVSPATRAPASGVAQ
jgi:hypothetical protein